MLAVACPASWAAPQRAGLLNAAGLAALIAAKSGGPKARVCPQFGVVMMAKPTAGPLSGKGFCHSAAVGRPGEAGHGPASLARRP